MSSNSGPEKTNGPPERRSFPRETSSERWQPKPAGRTLLAFSRADEAKCGHFSNSFDFHYAKSANGFPWQSWHPLDRFTSAAVSVARDVRAMLAGMRAEGRYHIITNSGAWGRPLVPDCDELGGASNFPQKRSSIFYFSHFSSKDGAPTSRTPAPGDR